MKFDYFREILGDVLSTIVSSAPMKLNVSFTTVCTDHFEPREKQQEKKGQNYGQ